MIKYIFLLIFSSNVFANILIPNMSLLEYKGAIRISSDTQGDTSANNSEGAFVIDEGNNSIFIVSKFTTHEVAEFNLPTFIISEDPALLNDTGNAIQNFTNLFDRAPTGNPQLLDRINGLYINNSGLFINTATFYDGPADNTHTTLLITNPSDLQNSPVKGFYEVEGRLHSAGWISEIPSSLKSELNGDLIMGFANNYAINSRNSIGPSAFILKTSDIEETIIDDSGNIKAFAGIDYNLYNFLIIDTAYNNIAFDGLSWDNQGQGWGYNPFYSNPLLRNDIWTELSEATYGIIIPGSDSYIVFGSSGGHEFGVGYKITQDNGNECGGPCSRVANDNYNYYWIYNINDIKKVINNEMEPYQVRPYAHGKLDLPHATKIDHKIGGGYFDKDNFDLYLSLRGAGQLGRFDTPPLILKFHINLKIPKAPSNLNIN